jgi:uncharacterized protein
MVEFFKWDHVLRIPNLELSCKAFRQLQQTVVRPRRNNEFQKKEATMKLTDSQIIQAPREVVWRGLNDAQVLKACIPGCESIEQLSPTELTAVVVAKVGPVKASFEGEVKLSDMNPPESYRISGTGQGGLAGFATGGATVKLTALGPNETQMDYDVDAQIGGKMAMLGSRLIDGTARSMAEQFFTKFASMMKAQATKQVASSPPRTAASTVAVGVAPLVSRIVSSSSATPATQVSRLVSHPTTSSASRGIEVSRIMTPVRAGSVAAAPIAPRIVAQTPSAPVTVKIEKAVAKPVTAKPVKKTVKKAAVKKISAKKTVKKSAPKKTSPKKTSAKKVVKKAAPKKPIKKVARRAAKKKSKR